MTGRGVRARFAALRQPPYSPPLTIWFLIGGAYYVICFVLLSRLLASGLPTVPHRVALGLLVALMVGNAAWGLLFFRRKDLRASFLAFLPYGLIALMLAIILGRVDRTAFWVFAAYLLYLGYATWWSHRLWVLNRAPAASGLTRA